MSSLAHSHTHTYTHFSSSTAEDDRPPNPPVVEVINIPYVVLYFLVALVTGPINEVLLLDFVIRVSACVTKDPPVKSTQDTQPAMVSVSTFLVLQHVYFVFCSHLLTPLFLLRRPSFYHRIRLTVCYSFLPVTSIVCKYT